MSKGIGIDLSPTKVAVVVIDPEFETAEYRVVLAYFHESSKDGFSAPANDPGARIDRVTHMYKVVTDVIGPLYDSDDMVAIEGYGGGPKTPREFTGETGGMVLSYINEVTKGRWVMVAPVQLKKFVCGDHLAKKEKMMIRTFQDWGYTGEYNNDLIDAFGLAEIAISMLDPTKCGATITKYRKEVLDKVKLGNKQFQRALDTREKTP